MGKGLPLQPAQQACSNKYPVTVTCVKLHLLFYCHVADILLQWRLHPAKHLGTLADCVTRSGGSLKELICQFSLHHPLGRFSLKVAMSVCQSVCCAIQLPREQGL